MLNRRRIVAMSLLTLLTFGSLVSNSSGQPAPAGPVTIHVHPPMPPDNVVIIIPPRPIPQRRAQPVSLTAANVVISIDEQVSTSSLELTLTNPSGAQQEAVVMIPVPDGVAIRSLQYDGAGAEPNASVLPRDEARRIYDEIVRRMKDPALVEFAGTNLIRTSAFPIPPNTSQKLSLTFEQLLPADGQRIDYWLPRTESLAELGVKWTIEGTIHSKRPITSIYSASHELDITKDNPSRVRFRVTNQSVADSGRGSFRLSYMTEPAVDALASTLIAYPDPSLPGGNGGFFMLVAGLPSAPADAPKVKREVVIVLDRSGSMRGEKLQQAKAAATQVVEGLDDGEPFNIIDYSDSINSFSEKPVLKNTESLKNARAYIAAIQAGGGTNIHDALIEALRAEPTPGTLPLVLFMTDGLPTVGERSEVKIREAAKTANKIGRRIFTFGVGYDVNSPLLSNLAKASRAASTFVQPQEDVEVKVSQVFRRLSGPVLANPKLSVTGTDGRGSGALVRELIPQDLPDVFEGDQVLVLGQYTNQATLRLRLAGEFRGKERSFDFAVDTKGASVKNSYVPRLWARARVANLIDEIRQASAEGNVPEARMKELTDEIVALSTKWGILTEYTSFLATPEAERLSFSPNVPTGESGIVQLRRATAEKLSARAGRDRDGAGGVNQEANLGKMQIQPGAAAATPAPMTNTTNRYYDENMKEVENRKIQLVADATLLYRNNRWIDTRVLSQENEKPDVEIDFASDAYFKLVDELAAEGRQAMLANAGDLYILHRNQRVLVRGQQ